MEKKQFTITFMGKGNASTVLNINRAIKNLGLEIIKSEHQLSGDSLAGYVLIQGTPQDNTKKIEERFKDVIAQFSEFKFFIQNAKLFNYVYSI